MAKIIPFLKFTYITIICAFGSVCHCNEVKTIEWVSENNYCGLFSNLTRLVEWIYCVKHNENFQFYLNMDGAYGFKGNTFPVLFKEFEDPHISLSPKYDSIWLKTSGFPGNYTLFKNHPTDGMKNFHNSKWIYMNKNLYKDPDFSIFRNRMYPIISQYIQPVPEIQDKIDTMMQRMNEPLTNQSNLKIGIHVRSPLHYQNYKKSSVQFLEDVERDIDQLMRGKDPKRTKIFLATLVEQLVERLSAKYNVVTCDIPRSPEVMLDWIGISNADPLDMARDAIVDTWCLAQCDELWGSSSNMVIFASCINPKLKICMLPSLKDYNGH